MNVTASDLVRAINQLQKNRQFNYINEKTPTKVIIHKVTEPEGPIQIKRFNPKKCGPENAKPVSVSSEALWRIANAIQENKPFQIDRVLGASFNYRSAIEALLSHTPQFYWCRPGRIETINTSVKVKPGHKYLIYLPNEPHENNRQVEKIINNYVSEIQIDFMYDTLDIQNVDFQKMSEGEKRQHSLIQIALMIIGKQLGSAIWIARNDWNIQYDDKKVIEIDGVIKKLETKQLLSAYPQAVDAAMNIDVIWFKNSHLMPAVFEIEHTTGVISGLARMNNFRTQRKHIQTRYVIVAPDSERDNVIKKASQLQFRDLGTKYLPYSAVQELLYLCQKRHISGVTDSFLDCFMEDCIVNG